MLAGTWRVDSTRGAGGGGWGWGVDDRSRRRPFALQAALAARWQRRLGAGQACCGSGRADHDTSVTLNLRRHGGAPGGSGSPPATAMGQGSVRLEGHQLNTAKGGQRRASRIARGADLSDACGSNPGDLTSQEKTLQAALQSAALSCNTHPGTLAIQGRTARRRQTLAAGWCHRGA